MAWETGQPCDDRVNAAERRFGYVLRSREGGCSDNLRGAILRRSTATAKEVSSLYIPLVHDQVSDVGTHRLWSTGAAGWMQVRSLPAHGLGHRKQLLCVRCEVQRGRAGGREDPNFVAGAKILLDKPLRRFTSVGQIAERCIAIVEKKGEISLLIGGGRGSRALRCWSE